MRVAWLNDSAVNRFLSYRFPITLDSTAAWFDRVEGAPNRFEYTVIDDGTSEIVGFCGLLEIDISVRRAEHHLFVGPGSHRRRGFGTAIYLELMRVAFDDLNLNRLYGYQHVDNMAAHRVVEKIGWVREGRLRQDGLYHDTVVDRYVISFLKQQWEMRGLASR